VEVCVNVIKTYHFYCGSLLSSIDWKVLAFAEDMARTVELTRIRLEFFE